MNRLARFEGFRYIGVRETMKVYDCDDSEQFERLTDLVDSNDLVAGNGIQTFAPDTSDEAASRGFRPAG